jgi:hypothetical protein
MNKKRGLLSEEEIEGLSKKLLHKLQETSFYDIEAKKTTISLAIKEAQSMIATNIKALLDDEPSDEVRYTLGQILRDMINNSK